MSLDDHVILNGLTSKRCVCGKSKGSMMSHCRNCYFALPPEKRKALYRRFNEGYQEAYRDSVEFLGISPERQAAYAEEMRDGRCQESTEVAA